MKKTIALFPAIALVFVAASCSTKQAPSTPAAVTTNKLMVSSVTTPDADPVGVVQDLLAHAKSGDDTAVRAVLAPGFAPASLSLLYPEKSVLVSAQIDYDPPLEFANNFRLVKAVFTPKSGDAQRYVYFLELNAAKDNWLVFHIEIGGRSAGTDKAIKTGKIDQEISPLQAIQKESMKSEFSWWTDPYLSTLASSIALGFDPHNDAYTLKDDGDVEVAHGDDIYNLHLTQPVTKGASGIWTIDTVTKE